MDAKTAATTAATTSATIAWLMEGDAAIRWQTQCDLLNAPPEQWQAEQARTAETGWGAQLLAQQEVDGRWGGGLYAPKWTSTTYTLLLLRSIGLPRHHAAAQRGAALVVDGLLGEQYDDKFRQKLAECDRCIVGMILSLAVYFQIEDERVDAIIENVLAERMPDGGWNCRKHRRPVPHHSSFNTTLNVLDGVRDALDLRPVGHGEQLCSDLLRAEQSALELLAQHKLFRSDKSGRVINPKFLQLSFPPYWHYDVLRALSYLARVDAPRDPRLQEAIELLRQKQLPNGTWPVQNRYTGKVFFTMERIDGPSRWNTLRALRILRWWGE
jgi:hypothetical protein